MKALIRLLLLFIFVSNFKITLIAQCPPTPWTISGDEDLIDFANEYPNCTEIHGDVIIINSQIDYNMDFTPLNQIEKIHGTLLFQAYHGTGDINGFEGLTYAKRIISYPGLAIKFTSISGFNALQKADKLELTHRDLEEITGFSSIDSIDQMIISRTNLTNLNGFSSATHIRELSISNSDIVGLSGLQNVSSMDDLYLFDNEDMLNISLPGVTLKNLKLHNNNSLQFLTGISLDADVGTIEMQNLDNLTTFDILNTVQTAQDIDIKFSIPISDAFSQLQSVGNIKLRGAFTDNGVNLFPNLTTASRLELYFGVGLSDLSLLANIQSIGELHLTNTGFQSLNNLSPNITSLDEFRLYGCNSLNDLSGLNNLSHCGILGLHNSLNLQDISALSNLTSCENLNISHCNSLPSLSGLTGLTTLVSLSIANNDELISLTGLDNLTQIEGSILLGHNSVLQNINSIGFINPNAITNLIIQDNPALSHCNVNSICSYLEFDVGPATIENNAYGCKSVNHVEVACGITDCLSSGNDTLRTQADIHNFASLAHNCHDLPGGLYLIDDGTDPIVFLQPLHFIETIGGDLVIKNTSLSSLNGFDDGIHTLTSIDGELIIDNNELLIDINELGGLDGGSITRLTITDNPILSICKVNPVCDYVSDWGKPGATISGNGLDCGSILDVLESCGYNIYSAKQNGNWEIKGNWSCWVHPDLPPFDCSSYPGEDNSGVDVVLGLDNHEMTINQQITIDELRSNNGEIIGPGSLTISQLLDLKGTILVDVPLTINASAEASTENPVFNKKIINNGDWYMNSTNSNFRLNDTLVNNGNIEQRFRIWVLNTLINNGVYLVKHDQSASFGARQIYNNGTFAIDPTSTLDYSVRGFGCCEGYFENNGAFVYQHPEASLHLDGEFVQNGALVLSLKSLSTNNFTANQNFDLDGVETWILNGNTELDVFPEDFSFPGKYNINKFGRIITSSFDTIFINDTSYVNGSQDLPIVIGENVVNSFGGGDFPEPIIAKPNSEVTSGNIRLNGVVDNYGDWTMMGGSL